MGNLAELAISYLLRCRHNSMEVAHILLLWSKHHLGSCVLVEGALVLQAVGKGEAKKAESVRTPSRAWWRQRVWFGPWGTAETVLEHSHSRARPGCGMWLWGRVVNTWKDGWDTSRVGEKLYKWETRALCFLRTVASSVKGELLWKVPCTEMLMKDFGRKLSEKYWELGNPYQQIKFVFHWLF